MTIASRCKRRSVFPCAVLMVVAVVFPAGAQTVLFDFGNDQSFRGLSVTNPDTNGNYWNSLRTGVFYQDLVDVDNNPTTIDFGFSTPVATDSYNGPAGPTSDATLETDVMFTDIDTASLGILGGALEAVFDFVAGPDLADNRVLFEIQQLDPTKTYDLTFFGSHKFSIDDTTVYSVYTDNTYSTLVDTVSLDVQELGRPDLHNRDRIAKLSNLSPQADNILYVEFIGAGGSLGYLNAMQLDTITPVVDGDYNEDGVVNAADYVLYRNNVGSNDPLPNDGGTLLPVGQGHYDYWKARFGNTAGSGTSAAVPEPSTLLLLSLLTCGTLWSRRSLQRLLGPKRLPLTTAP